MVEVAAGLPVAGYSPVAEVEEEQSAGEGENEENG